MGAADPASKAVPEPGPAKARLARKLGVWSAAAVVVGGMIGSGIFRVPQTVAAETGSPGLIMLVWVAGGAIALAGALSLAEAAALFPRAGGLYAILFEAYGPLVAFLYGWLTLIISPASTGAVALVFAEYLGRLIPLTPLQVRAVAIGAIILVAAANYRSVRLGAAIQNVFTSAKLLALVGLIAAAFLLTPRAVHAAAAMPAGVPLSPTWSGFGLALVAALWAYNGWQDGTLVAGEVRNPGRSLPVALIGGALVVTVLYLGANLAYLHVLPVGAIAASPLVASDVAVRLVGSASAALIAALVAVSTFGTVNENTMVFPRVFFAMAGDGLFFRTIAAVHPRYGTPHTAIVLSAGLSVLYVALRSFEELVESVILGYIPFWALAVAAVIVFRRTQPALQRPYRAVGYPVLPLLFVLAMLALALNSLRLHPATAGPTLGALLAGVPVYYAWATRLRQAR
jgi:amino acid transporter